MPYVNVRITRDGVTAEHKARIVQEITRTLQDVLGKKLRRGRGGRTGDGRDRFTSSGASPTC